MRARWLVILALGVIGCESLRSPPAVPGPSLEMTRELASGGREPPASGPNQPVASGSLGGLTPPARQPVDRSDNVAAAERPASRSLPQTDPLTLAAEAL